MIRVGRVDHGVESAPTEVRSDFSRNPDAWCQPARDALHELLAVAGPVQELRSRTLYEAEIVCELLDSLYEWICDHLQ